MIFLAKKYGKMTVAGDVKKIETIHLDVWHSCETEDGMVGGGCTSQFLVACLAHRICIIILSKELVLQATTLTRNADSTNLTGESEGISWGSPHRFGAAQFSDKRTNPWAQTKEPLSEILLVPLHILKVRCFPMELPIWCSIWGSLTIINHH